MRVWFIWLKVSTPGEESASVDTGVLGDTVFELIEVNVRESSKVECRVCK